MAVNVDFKNLSGFKSLVQEAIDDWSNIYDGLNRGRHNDQDFLDSYGDEIKALVQYHNSMVNLIGGYLPVHVRPDIRYKTTDNTIVSNIEEACWYTVDISISRYVSTVNYENGTITFEKSISSYQNLVLPPNTIEITNQVPINNDFPVSIKVSLNKPFGIIGDGPELFLEKPNAELNNHIEPDKWIDITIPGKIVIGYKQGNYEKLQNIYITKESSWIIPNPQFDVNPKEIKVKSDELDPTISSPVTISNANTLVRVLSIDPDFVRTYSNDETLMYNGNITVVLPNGSIQKLPIDTSTFDITKIGQYQFYINDLIGYRKVVNVILDIINKYKLSTQYTVSDSLYIDSSNYSHIEVNGGLIGNNITIGKALEFAFLNAINYRMSNELKSKWVKNLSYSFYMKSWLHNTSNADYGEFHGFIRDELNSMGLLINLVQTPTINNANRVEIKYYYPGGLISSRIISIVPDVGPNPFAVKSGQFGAGELELNTLLVNDIIDFYANNYWFGYFTINPYIYVHGGSAIPIVPENINANIFDIHLNFSMEGFTSSVGVIPVHHFDSNGDDITVYNLNNVYPQLFEEKHGEYLHNLRIDDVIWDKVSYMNLVDFTSTFDSLPANFSNFGYSIIKHLGESELVFPSGNSGSRFNWYSWIEKFNEYEFNTGELTLFEPFYFMESYFTKNNGLSGETSASPGIDNLYVTMTGFYDLFGVIKEIESFDPNNIMAKVGGYARWSNLSTVDKMIVKSGGFLNFAERDPYEPDVIYDVASWTMPLNEFPVSLLQAIMDINKPHNSTNWHGAPWFFLASDLRDPLLSTYDYKDNPIGFDYLERPFGNTTPRRLSQFIFPFPGLYELSSQIPVDSSYQQYCVPIYVFVSPVPSTGIPQIEIINGYKTNSDNSPNTKYINLIKPFLPNGFNMDRSDGNFESIGIRVVRPRDYTLAKGFSKSFNIQDRL